MATKNKNKIFTYIIAVVIGVAAFLAAFFLIKPPISEQTAIYRYTDDNGTIIEMTYFAKGDRVYKQTSNNIVPYSALGVSSAEEAKELFEEALAEGKNIKGYSDEVEYGDDAIIETVTIDYDTVDINEVKNLQGAYFSDGDVKNGVSFEKSIKRLEENGFKKVEK